MGNLSIAEIEAQQLGMLAKSRELERSHLNRDRSRTQESFYNPKDLVPHAKDPTVVVSDAGLDRGPLELLRHLTLQMEGTRTSRYDSGEGQPHLTNKVQNPLDSYYHRQLLAPEDHKLNKAFWRAGRRLRGDWTTAGNQPRLVGRAYTGMPGGAAQVSPGDAQLDAVDRLAAALRRIHEAPRTCVVAVACVDQSVTDWAKHRTWPKAEAAMDFLRLALDALRKWYSQVDAEKRIEE